jgi:cytochrome bd ubiquinol oxidase subunit I
MFGGIYTLLFVLWVYVLHQKISHGPDAHDEASSPSTPRGGALHAAAERPAHNRSLTQPK